LKVRILSVAEAEATEAALHYEQRRPGLGERFLDELEHALARIRHDPELLARVENYAGPYDVRRCMLHRFPYIVVFLIHGEEAVVIAVSDARRRPFYWLDRLN
jgi:plasmid stabilization system protein ParE